MILLLLAAEAATPGPQENRFANCVALTESDPARALDEAGAWKIAGGGVLARQCEGLAYSSQKRWMPAALAFEQAARIAEREQDGRAARLWVQAGNATLAGNDAARARAQFDAALASQTLTGAEAGEVHLDRARASVALKDDARARLDLDSAKKLVPQDPLAWLLSATLARRTGDLDRARADIAEAARLAPDEAAVAVEAGNIAMLSGATDAARTAWQAAVRASPDSQSGKAATTALKQLGTP
jgi:tetratricopeptide (TPR) repeat protein